MSTAEEQGVEPIDSAAEPVEDTKQEPSPEPEASGGNEEQERQDVPAEEEKPEAAEPEIQPAAEPVDTSPSPEHKSSSKPAFEVHVDLLDGEVLKITDCDRKVKARDVIERAHDKQDTEEKDFFSVFYYDGYDVTKDDQQIHLQQKIFLDPLKQVKPQMFPTDKQNPPVLLSYGVKYYVPDPSKLREDYSRYLYCVQLCDDIRRNRVRVDRETAIRLTALMLQATLDDYDPDVHKPGYTEKFQNFQLLPTALQPENYEAQVIEVHKAKTGYTPAMAEAEFLQLAKDLPRYGQHLFLAKDVDGNPVMIGNNWKGVSIYHDYNADIESKLIWWRDIVKISYKRHKFRVKYYPQEHPSDGSKRPVLYSKFYTGDPPQAKRIWKNAVEQHAFFRLTAPEPPSFMERLIRRTSFRFSGNTLRQSMRSKLKRDHYDFSRRTLSMRAAPRRKFVVGKESVEETTWVILDRPPAGNAIDLDKFERQKVVVDFRLTDDKNDQAQRYVLRKDTNGSYQMLDTISYDDEKERNFHLSEVDEESKAAIVTVTLNVEAPTDVTVTHVHDDHLDYHQPVFDSKRMPVVKIGGATRVTTASVVESDGRPVTSGQHSQRYPLEEVADVESEVVRRGEDWQAETVGPAVEGSEEAKQVDLFLEREGELMTRVMEEQEKPQQPPEVEIEA